MPHLLLVKVALKQQSNKEKRHMSKPAAEHHLKAAEHHEHAARHHKEAAKHHQTGNHEKAAHHAHTARAHEEHAELHSAEAAKAHPGRADLPDRAGHGVAVLLKIYAHCIDGQADAANC